MDRTTACSSIAFQSDAAAGLALIAPDGTSRRELVRLSNRAFASDWSPSGDRIAWADPSGALWVLDIADPGCAAPISGPTSALADSLFVGP